MATSEAGPKRDGADLVREEYFFLQKTINDFNSQSLEIKKLSLGLSAGGVFLNNWAKLGADAAMVSVMLLALGFWMLDWLWKEFQRNHYPRVSEIELQLRDRYDISPWISGGWFGSHARQEKPRRFELKSLFWPQVWLPHAPIAAICLTVLVVSHRHALHLG